jgi:hypothetical protein
LVDVLSRVTDRASQMTMAGVLRRRVSRLNQSGLTYY